MLATLFSFWPAFAASAIAIPVIIHLINRKRFKIVPWAAMKFLLAAQKQTRKRMRIEQLLLLLVRMLILALILFAMVAVMNDPNRINAEGLWQWLDLAKWGPSKPIASQRTHHIFVLDASLSMNQKVEGGQTAFEAARQMAMRKLNDSSSGDGYSVLILKDSPTWLVGEAAQDTRKVGREIEGVKASHGNASLPAALNMISAKLNEARGRFPKQAVYFFTDMQQATWLGATPGDQKGDSKEKNPYLEIEEKAATVFVDCGPAKDAGNLAIANLEFDLNQTPYVTTGTKLTLLATVRNFGVEAARTRRPELIIGKAKDNPNDPPMQMRVEGAAPYIEDEEHPIIDQLQVAAHSQQTIKFTKKFDKAGTYAVQVKLGEDALEPDNARTIIITVRETIPVLLVNGKASVVPTERATEFLRVALNPYAAGTEPKGWPLRPKVVTPAQFSDMTDQELEQFDCVFWCDVGQFGGNDVRKVDSHVRRGGGFIVSLGDSAAKNLDTYNRLLHKGDHGLLPAELKKRIEAPKFHNFYLQNTDDQAYSVPPLAAFSDDRDRLTLRTARFTQYVQSVAPEGKARTILMFVPEYTINDDKVERDNTLPASAPAIVEWNPPLSRAQQPAVVKPGQRADQQSSRYRGKVVLLTTAVNLDWSSPPWPGSPSFVPLMHELTRFALSGRLREQSQTVGGVLDGFVPGPVEVDVAIKFPPEIEGVQPGKAKTQVIDDVNLFRWAETDFAGVYRAETSAGAEIPFAVNIPTATPDQKGSESDLQRLDEGKLKESYPGWTVQVVRDPLRAVTGGPTNDDAVEVPQPVGPLLANIALLMVLALLFVEIVLAWHFGHYTTTEGALSQTVPSTTATAIAAACAVIATLALAFCAAIMIHNNITGDFLGFLPDLVREWLEVGMSLEKIPGEGRNWDLQSPGLSLIPLPGSLMWYGILLTGAAAATIFFTYRAEGPRVPLVFKMLLGVLRLGLIITCLWGLLPAWENHYNRKGWPDLVLLIDDTRSMGEPDTFQDPPVIEKVKKLSELIRANLERDVPIKIAALTAEIAAKSDAAANDPDAKAEVDGLKSRQHYWQKQLDNLQTGKWRPSRLQLVQAILTQPEPHWLKTLLTKHQTKVHIFHLDAQGRATKLRDPKGDAGELTSPSDMDAVKRAIDGIVHLEPVGNDSRLGTAVRQVIDHYRGSSLSSVIMFTDGVTTRDETLSQAADYAAQRSVGLFFIGVGDENEMRDLKLHDLNVDDPIYLGDRAVFEVRVTGHGYKNLTVPVILKLKDPKTGKEKEVDRAAAKIDPRGTPTKLRLRDQPKKAGAHQYIIEIEPPKLEANEKPIPQGNLRVERTIEVIDIKLIKVLYVEGQPRYEFRYVKFLLEREMDQKNKKKKAIDLKVLLLDADPDFHKNDATALEHFPPTLRELNDYDVLVIGDCNPDHPKLRNNLKNIVAYVRGENEKGQKGTKPGGGLMFMAGAFYNPHAYKGTPLADVLPIEPMQAQPPKDEVREKRWRPLLTPAGRVHPMFRFGPDEGENMAIWNRLAPIYWYSSKYRLKPLAEVLAVHPDENAEFNDPNNFAGKHPLIVQMFVGTGRSMFFGIDETWRWRKGEDESKFTNFWIQSMRYLSRGRSTRTDLRLDRQTPYRVGEKIKVTVRFPDSTPGAAGNNPNAPKIDAKTEVKVTVTHTAPDGKESEQPRTLTLAKMEGSWGTYEATDDRTREGKYKFRLTNPDVSATQPDGQKPSAEAIVELPPGELDKLRMDYQEMIKAASTSNGEFFTLANADNVLEVIPPGSRNPIHSNVPPTLLWNQWWVLGLIVLLITSEWVLRKMKHLL